jgi:hypothetical protein
MASLLTFNTSENLNHDAVRREISIPVIRERLVSKNHQDVVSQYDMVSVRQKDGTFKRIDEVPRKRPFIKFQDAYDWIISEFSRIGLDFKLRKSVIETRKMSLYQEYIFNREVATPDGEGISPMVLLKASHSRSGAPLGLNLGTFRYVCSNGAINTVGRMTTIKITEKTSDIYTKSGLHRMLILAFEQYDTVSHLYAKLAQIKAVDAFDALFSDSKLSLRLRKKVLEKLESENRIRIIRKFDDYVMDNSLSKTKYLTREMLEEPAKSIALTRKDMSLWDVYNDFTERVTHSSSTSAGMLYGSKSVNMAFQAIVKNGNLTK